MLLKEDYRHQYVRCNVRSRIKIATDDPTPSVGWFFGIIRQPNHSEHIEDLYRGWDFVGSSEWWESSALFGQVLLLLQTPAHRSSKGIYHFAAWKKNLRLMSDMPDSNRNWKSKYFFIKGTDWECHPEEWVTMPHGFDNTWAYVKDSGLTPSAFTLTSIIYSNFSHLFAKCFNVVILDR